MNNKELADIHIIDRKIFNSFIINYFKNSFNKKFILVVGGATGVNDIILDNIRIQDQSIILEPVEWTFNLLKKRFKDFPNTICINKAVDNQEVNEKDFYWFPKEAGSRNARIGSFYQDHSIKCERKPEYINRLIKKSKVKCITITSIIKQYKIENLNIFQCDAERHDYTIFKSFPFELIKPNLFKLEWNFATPIQKIEIKEKLISLNYKVFKCGLDIIGINKEKTEFNELFKLLSN